MTRLQTEDIRHITSRLADYSRDLETKTGRSLPEIACHAWGVTGDRFMERRHLKKISVVPVTAGLGIISRFSDTVAAILTFLGCRAAVTDRADVAGLAEAVESGSDAVMMADDDRFVAIDLRTRQVTDNADATGRGFAAALDGLAGRIRDRDVLVMGCGPVGAAGALRLTSLGARVALLDPDGSAAERVKHAVTRQYPNRGVTIETDLDTALSRYRCILEATPAKDTIPRDRVTPDMRVAAPGVPPGVSAGAAALLGPHLVHDTLEIGVAAMAAALVCEPARAGRKK